MKLLAPTAETRKRMKATKRRDTAGELALRSQLHRLGLRFRVDYPLPGTRRRADIAFPRQRVAVYSDGCFWHGCPEHGTWPKRNAEWWKSKIEANRKRDSATDRALAELGWIVIRVWEHENPDEAVTRVEAIVKRRSRS